MSSRIFHLSMLESDMVMHMIIMIILLIIIIGYTPLQKRNYTISSSKITQDIKICVLSDLHGTSHGKHQKKLAQMIIQQQPDMILYVGDMIDERCHLQELEDLLKEVSHIPSYFVLGNHEVTSGQLQSFLDLMDTYHVQRVSQKKIKITVSSNDIILCGIDDYYSFYRQNDNDHIQEFYHQYQHLLSHHNDHYTILLSHRPSFYQLYQDSLYDLVVCGHAHGGQWRIPYLLNGLYAPDESLFPQHAGGQYHLKKGYMIVSRGLVKNMIPRFFNPPECVFVTLKNQHD